jgi:hypothetical protein
MFYGRPGYWLSISALRDRFPGFPRRDRQITRPARRALPSAIRARGGSEITSLVELDDSLPLKTHTSH